jgi:hypothetical protein
MIAMAEITTIRITKDQHAKLNKIGAKLTLKDGKNRTMGEVLDILIENYEG